MNSKNNLKGLMAIGISDILGTGATAIFWFYLASIISPDQYGEIFFYLAIASIISSIALFATKNTITVYVAKKIPLQSTLYFISLCGTFIASLVIIMWFYRIDVGLVIVGYGLYGLAIGELLGRKLFNSYSKYVLLQKFSVVLLGISFFYIFGVNGILYAIALSYSAYTIIVYKGLTKNVLNFSLLKQHIGFVTNNYSISIAQISRSQIDKLMIPIILSFSILGHYALALQIMGMLNLFSGIVFKFILPYDATGKSNLKIKLFTVLISICLAISGIVLAPILVPILFPEYVEAITAIQIMSITVFPTSIMFILTSKLLGLEKSKYVLISKLISIIIISSSMIVLGTLFELTGLALAYLIATSADAISLSVFSYLINKKNY